MICLRNNMPLVVLGESGGEDDDIVEFENDWLALSLVEAALQAGHGDNWFHAQGVAKSVALHLELDFDGTVVTLAQITALAKNAVSAIGYKDIARRLHLAAPPMRISLDDVARDAGQSYELRFFDILRTRLQQAAANRRVEIHNVRDGILRLGRSRKWSARCKRMLAEIVGFVQGATQSLSLPNIQIQMQR